MASAEALPPRRRADRRPVVVLADNPTALRWAAREAALRHRELHVVGATGASTADAERIAAEAAPGVVVTWAAARANVPEFSHDAELVVVGSRTPVRRPAACPVVYVPGEGGKADGPIVVGVDGTPEGESAIAFAFAEASLHAAPLIAVHCSHASAAGVARHGGFAVDPGAELRYRDLVAHNAQELVSERLAGWREQCPDVPGCWEVRGGSPAEALVRLSRIARLVVVGSRGRRLFRSTGRALLRHTEAPVVVVNPGRRS